MCSRLHAIGFPCEMDRQTAEFIGRAALSPRRKIVTPRGEYRIWRSTSGAEIWLHYAAVARSASKPAPMDAGPQLSALGPLADLTGMSVAHAGSSLVDVRLARVLATSPRNPLDGTGIATLKSRRSTDKPIAFTFELLGFAAEARTVPCDVRLQVTALAQKVWGYASEKAYLSATPPGRLIGKGALAEVDDPSRHGVPLVYRQKPGTLWLATGEVRRSMRLVNPVTRAPYYLIELDTDRGIVDVLANPTVIDGDVSDGHTVQVLAAMVGRIV